jgi:hypothetical protein
VAISHKGARADAAAARLASVAASRNNVSQAPFGYEISKTLAATQLALEGTSRQLIALQVGDEAGQAIGAADQVAFERLLEIAREMGAPPDASSPLDGYARVGLASRSIDIAALVAEQNHQADFGGRAASQGMAAVIGLSLAALAGVLVGLAAVVGQGRPGTALLVLGYVLAGSALAAGLFAAGWVSGG